MKTCRKQGVALVVTLIMLSVITFLVVAFLLMSNRDRAATNVKSIQTDTKNANDSALAHAQVSIVAAILSRTNSSNGFEFRAFDYLVSTNFINPLGFRGNLTTNLTNVSYTHPSGRDLGGNDQLQNLANLYYSPRPPVYVDTDYDGKVDEFRYYLDFNRNRMVDTNGLIVERDNNNQPTGRTNYYLGDPEWIGQLANPNLPHSGTNRFLSRFAYLVFPVGKTLDLNVMHNQTKRKGTASEGFYRNQGAGTFELNLAAFLNDLNTNIWPAGDNDFTTESRASAGLAYDDAMTLVRYRYNGDYNTGLYPINKLFSPGASATLANNFVDDYADGGYVADRYSPSAGPNGEDDTSLAWPGSPSTNSFWDMQELFYTNRVYSNFVYKLLSAGTNQSTYDRYTYYRLLSQMGTETTSTTDNRLNINYANRGTNVLTNLVAWAPVEFFTNAAVEMMKQGGFSYALSNNTFNIEVYPTNRYTSPLHRMLQMAANIYDASTNSPYPSVFRPIYVVEGTNVFIRRFVQETNIAGLTPTNNWVELSDAGDRARLVNGTNLNVFGIPLVVGTKKGVPNFNEFTMDSVFLITRKLAVFKPSTNAARARWQTNQMLIAGISNVFGLEAWNSYSRPNSNAVQLVARLQTSMVLTNQRGEVIWPSGGRPMVRTFSANQTNFANSWQGGKFRVVLTNTLVFLPNSIFDPRRTPQFTNDLVQPFRFNTEFPVPNWGLSVSNKLHYFLFEPSTGRILDVVNISTVSGMDIIRELTSSNQAPMAAEIWLTNYVANPSGTYPLNLGVVNQIEVSRGAKTLTPREWDYFRPTGPSWVSRETAIEDFKLFIGMTSTSTNRNILNSRTNEVPFAPIARVIQRQNWQVNDPIVHYHLDDLNLSSNSQHLAVSDPFTSGDNLDRTNTYYHPWSKGRYPTDLSMKDSTMFSSEDWDFPTNKFPTVGWLGRVHRGTPWQSIYLKSPIADLRKWRDWATFPQSHPTNDWLLADLFSTSPSALTAQGQLSINQTNLAAWSAVLGGVSVLTNNLPGVDLSSKANVAPRLGTGLSNIFIHPSSPQLLTLVNAINRERNLKTNQVFTSLKDILAVPELTVSSPFLNTNSAQLAKGINDAAYERIPQQIFSLVRVGEPRFVVYAFGQALRPAPNSVLSRPGPFFQMVTNYQIAGEVVTKAVIRIDGAPDKPKVVMESYKILSPE